VQNDVLYYPNEKTEEELPFFISEHGMDVSECFWMSKEKGQNQLP